MSNKSKDVFSFLMLNVTLPCAIIMNLNGEKLTLSSFLIIAIGILFNCISLIIGWALGKKYNTSDMIMINVSGYNIGGFAMPFIIGILDKSLVVLASVFDIGNSIMCLGVNYSIVCSINNPSKKVSLKDLIINITRSVPVLTYIFMITMILFNCSLSQYIMPYFSEIGKANTFVALFMIGLSLNLDINKEDLQIIMKCVLIRLLISTILSLFSCILPISLELRKLLFLMCFSPIGAASIAYTKKLGLDDEQSSCINSIYIMISIIMMSTIISLLP